MVFPGITKAALEANWATVRSRFDALIRSMVVKPVGGDATDIIRYLQQSQVVVADSLISTASVYSKAAWLWYLRRLPDEVFVRPGQVDTAGYYSRQLAESLTGIGGSDASLPEQTTPDFPVSASVSEVVINFVTGVNYLARIHLLTRNGNRGVRLTLAEAEELPFESWTSAQREAAELYWGRLAATGRFMVQAGTDLGEGGYHVDTEGTLLTVDRIKARRRTIKGDLAASVGRSEILQSYTLQAVSIRRVAQFASLLPFIEWPSAHFQACALVLNLLRRLAPTFSWSLASTVSLGYVSIDYDRLTSWFDLEWNAAIGEMRELLPKCVFPNNAADLCVALQRPPDGLVPLDAGPILRIDGNLALLDIHAATFILASLDFVTDQGEVANIRSKHFEHTIQGTVDQTPWRVGDPHRELIGKTLRLDGRDITDVDAVAIKDGCLLLISAKSIVYTPDYDEGSYRAMRNAATTVVQACVAASDLAALLTENRKGDNYDLTLFTSIEVVVCTAYVVHVPIGPATRQIADGLMAAVSLTELKRHLEGGVRGMT